MIPFWRQSFYSRVIGLTPVGLKGDKETFYFLGPLFVFIKSLKSHGELAKRVGPPIAGPHRVTPSCRCAHGHRGVAEFLGGQDPPLLAFANGTDGARLARPVA